MFCCLVLRHTRHPHTLLALVTVTRTRERSCRVGTSARVSQPSQQQQQQCKQLNKEVTPEALAAQPAAVLRRQQRRVASNARAVCAKECLKKIYWQLLPAITAAQGKNHSKPGSATATATVAATAREGEREPTQRRAGV